MELYERVCKKLITVRAGAHTSHGFCAEAGAHLASISSLCLFPCRRARKGEPYAEEREREKGEGHQDRTRVVRERVKKSKRKKKENAELLCLEYRKKIGNILPFRYPTAGGNAFSLVEGYF